MIPVIQPNMSLVFQPFSSATATSDKLLESALAKPFDLPVFGQSMIKPVVPSPKPFEVPTFGQQPSTTSFGQPATPVFGQSMIKPVVPSPKPFEAAPTFGQSQQPSMFNPDVTSARPKPTVNFDVSTQTDVIPSFAIQTWNTHHLKSKAYAIFLMMTLKNVAKQSDLENLVYNKDSVLIQNATFSGIHALIKMSDDELKRKIALSGFNTDAELIFINIKLLQALIAETITTPDECFDLVLSLVGAETPLHFMILLAKYGKFVKSDFLPSQNAAFAEALRLFLSNDNNPAEAVLRARDSCDVNVISFLFDMVGASYGHNCVLTLFPADTAHVVELYLSDRLTTTQ